jgi:hypothetical protein
VYVQPGEKSRVEVVRRCSKEWAILHRSSSLDCVWSCDRPAKSLWAGLVEQPWIQPQVLNLVVHHCCPSDLQKKVQ